jgi:hypothetical protein
MAQQLLTQQYATTEPLLPGNRCPLDQTETRTAYFVYQSVTLGYLLCQREHALRRR